MNLNNVFCYPVLKDINVRFNFDWGAQKQTSFLVIQKKNGEKVSD